MMKILLLTSLFLLLSAFELSAQNSYTVAIDWSQFEGKIDAAHWGVADYEIVDTAKIKKEGYVQFMQALKPSFVRIHQSSLIDSWTDEETQTWDSDYIIRAFQLAEQAYGDAKVMLNPVPSWPDWLTTDLILTPDQEDVIVRLFAEMAVIVKNNGLKVDYWEVTNERDQHVYGKTNEMYKLYNLYNRVHDTIKHVIPEAKIGGLAFTYPNNAWITGFLDSCSGRYDFISWHNYANGPDNRTNDSVLVVSKPSSIVDGAIRVMDELRERGLENEVESFVTEYNIQWVWTPIDERHGNFAGAMFQAAVVNRLAAAGITGANVWHNKGNAYGLIDSNDNLRATGLLYKWGTRYLSGNRPLTTQSPSRNKLETIAIQNQLDDRSVLLINKSSLSTIIPFDSLGLNAETRILTIDKHSFYAYPISVKEGKLELPPMSLVLVTTQQADENIPPQTPELSGFTQFKSATINVSNLSDNESFAGFKLLQDGNFHGFYTDLSTIEVTGLEEGTEYLFSAIASDEEGNSSDTSQVLSLVTRQDVEGPTIPSRLQATQQNETVLLSWRESLDQSGVLNYVVFKNDEPLVTLTENQATVPIENGESQMKLSVFAIDTKGNHSDTASLVVDIDLITSIKSSVTQFYPSPNPIRVGTNLHLNGIPEMTSLKLYNLMGREILSVEQIADNKWLLPSHLQEGLYLIKLNGGNKVYSSRIIIIN